MKRFHLLTCLVSLLSFAACTSELDAPVVTGEEVNVTFTANLSDAVQTRAFSDGALAKDLFYSVFIGDKAVGLKGEKLPFDEGTNVWTVNLNLVRGVTYDVVFWAQAEDAPYVFNPENGQVTYKEGAELKSNDNTMDAFFHKETINVSGPLVKGDIVLRRALAQINVGTNDLEEAKKLGLSSAGAESSSMDVTGVSTGFNLLTGKALEEQTDITFTDAGLTNWGSETFNISGDAASTYNYLVRNYVFAAGNVDVSFNVKYNGGAKILSYDVPNVPVKTNYRTNIYGQLFTNPLSVNVSIDNAFKGEHKVELLEAETIEDLKKLLETNPGKDKNIKYTGDAPTGDTEIEIPEGVTGNVALDLPAINGEGKYTITASETEDESPKKIDVTVPAEEASSIVVNAPNATVTVNGEFKSAIATTANDTFIIASGSTVDELTVMKGNVTIMPGAKVGKIIRHEDNADQETILKIYSEEDMPETEGEFKVFLVGRISIGDTSYATLEEAIANAVSGDVISLVDGEYTLPFEIKLKDNAKGTLTFAGAGENTVLNGMKNNNSNLPGNYARGLTLILKNLTHKTANNGYNGGFAHAESVSFEACKIIGQYYVQSGAPHVFTKCTIDPLNGYLYTYGADCIFDNCTFTSSEGKALQVYAEANPGWESTITIKECTFSASKTAQTWDKKPVTAIDINSIYGNKFTVNITNTTATGYATGLFSNSTLWNIKGGEENVTITIDGEKVSYTE